MTPRTSISSRSIPAMTAGPITEERDPVLLWVRTGTATVEAAGESYRLTAGEAIWVPPGVEHRTRTDEGSVVLPVLPAFPKPRDALAEVRTITVPPRWENWLVSQSDPDLHHTQGWRSDIRALLGLADRAHTGEAGGLDAHAALSLPMPHSREARTVAQAILRAPGSLQPLAHFAAGQSVSPRTLQRQFHAETGMVFSVWRTRARVIAAAGHLNDGHPIGWTGRHVGFATPAGFTRAFRQHLGMAPRQYASDPRGPRDRNVTVRAEEGDYLSALVAEETPPPPPIPPRQGWSWVEDRHVLWWTYYGSVRMRIGTREFTLDRGQAIWLPAGLTASVEDLAHGSIVLPLGDHHGRIHIGAEELRVFTFPDDAETFLLHTVHIEYSLFRADAEQARLADELFREQFVLARETASDGLTGAVATIARALYRDPADARTLSAWASHLGLEPRRLSQEFLTQTGSSFPRWRAQLRMNHARTLLLIGDSPHEVATVLGYASTGAFGKVFSRAHGVTPRAYQQRVSSLAASDE